MPARQQGSTSAGVEILRRSLRWNLPPAASHRSTGVAKTVEIDAGPTIDRAQQGHRLVGLRPAMICGDAVEAGLYVAAGYGVEGAGEPIAEMAVGLVAVEFVGRLRAAGIGGHVVLEGVAEGRHGTRLRALPRWVVAAGDLAEGRLCQASGLIGGDFSVAAQDDLLVGCFPAAVAGSVVDDEGLGAGGMHPDAEPGELVVPRDPGLVGGLESVDGTLGDGELGLGDAFSGLGHGGIGSWRRQSVNTLANT